MEKYNQPKNQSEGNLGNNDYNNRNKKSNKGKLKKYLKWGFIIGSICFVLGILSIVGFIFSVGSGAFGELPTVEDLEKIKNPTASEVYAADGKLLGRYYLVNRTTVPYKNISKHVVNALVATEDTRFFKHKGVDTKSIFRVLIKTLLMQDQSSGGGSTINQQLIKNLYKRDRYGKLTMPVNKVKEMIVGRRLEKVFTKEDILTHYLNTVPFGERVFGIEAAANRFYSKSAKELSLDEAATLIGMLKATTSYSPRRNPERSKERRNVVLNQMVKYGYIDETLAGAAKVLPISLNYNKLSNSDGLAPHFREMIKGELKEWCKNHKKPDGSAYNLFTDGLKIYTTIDSKMQEYAEASVKKHLQTLQTDFNNHWGSNDPWGNDQSLYKNAMRATNLYKTQKAKGREDRIIDLFFDKKREMTVFANGEEKEVNMTPKDSIEHYLKMLNTGFMAMEHKTGHIKAYVGSIDHKYFPYDHTRSTRQVGSTFKPIVYATALENGIEPCSFYGNELRTYIDEYNKEWTPRNSDGDYEGEYSMRGGLAKSVNTISVQLLFDAGVEKVVELAKKLGIKSDIPAYPSIALGTPDISLQEMLKVYASFANGGYKIEPLYLSEIKNSKNESLEKFNLYSTDLERVIQLQTANTMTEMLQAVVDSGTGRRLRFMYNLNQDFAGKTGTTQNQSDGWFIGYSPDIVAGVWTGGQSRLIRFNSIQLGQGANMALPVFGEFFRQLYANKKYQKLANASFREPDVYLAENLDCELWRAGPPEILADNSDFLDKLDELLRRNKIERNNNSSSSGSQGSKSKPKVVKSKSRIGDDSKKKKDKVKIKPKKKKENIWHKLFGGKD